MIKRILALIIVLGVLGLCGCGSKVARDTMTVELRWSYPLGTCYLGIRGPGDNEPPYFDYDDNMPDGDFSDPVLCDDDGIAIKRWALNYNHRTGLYTPMVYSPKQIQGGYAGRINLTVNINGNMVYAYEEIGYDETLIFMDFHVARAGGAPSYRVVRMHGKPTDAITAP